MRPLAIAEVSVAIAEVFGPNARPARVQWRGARLLGSTP